MMKFGLSIVLVLLLGCGVLARAESAFTLGMTRDAVLKALGKPTLAQPMDQDGREMWIYNRATVTFLRGKLITWRNFDEKIPVELQGSPVRLGSSKDEAMAVLGFPPTARLLTGLVIGRKPLGEEEWTYSVGTLIFQDGLVMGWRDVRTPYISLGAKQEQAKAPEIGSPAPELVAAFGTPPTLTCYVESGDQLWAYPKESLVVSDGMLAWRGVPKPRELPPVRVTKPATSTTTTGTTGATTKPEDDKGFINNPDFPAFRLGYETVLNQIQANNPQFVNSLTYKAMQDCLQQRSWWAIKAQAEVNPEYAQGVRMILQAYSQFVAQRNAVQPK